MATSVLSSHLRRSRPSFLLPFLAQLINPSRLPLPPHPTLPSPPFDTCTSHFRTRFNSCLFLGNFHSRAFSTYFPDDDSELGDNLSSELQQVESELFNGIEQVTAVATTGEDCSFPVRAVISMLDGFHDLTGLPWWMIIASSTLALRIVLLPLLILQLHKLKSLPNAGRSFKDQFLLFWKEGKAVAWPTILWQLPFLTVQIPCFILWMVTIRRMSVDGHPGFICGGALWFQDLTELPHGWSGCIFPLLIASLHYTNVKVSLPKTVVGKAGSTRGLLAEFHKWCLEFLMLPIAIIGFAIPQGGLLYWFTNSSLTIVQQLTLRHPTVLAKLGLQHNNTQKEDSEKSGAPKMIPLDSTVLHDKSSPITASEETSASKTASLDSPEKWFKIPAENLSPRELTAISVQVQSNGDKESAIRLLRLALDKDPEYVRALVLMGRFLLQKKLNAEAMEYFERAISKLSLAGQSTEVEDVDHLILASQWAGVACERQGKRIEGLVHFERVAKLEEPEDPACKAHYFDGLLLLASTLYDAGQKDEAAKYLRLVVAYNPAHSKFLDLCEREG